jgi:hypothetical protein
MKHHFRTAIGQRPIYVGTVVIQHPKATDIPRQVRRRLYSVVPHLIGLPVKGKAFQNIASWILEAILVYRLWIFCEASVARPASRSDGRRPIVRFEQFWARDYYLSIVMGSHYVALNHILFACVYK